MNRPRSRDLSPAGWRPAGVPAVVALRLGAALTLLVAVLAASVLAGPARGIVFAQDDAGTPATGLQGIAHGVQLLSDDDIAWRVIRDQAPANEDDEATPAERTLGFVLAEDGPLLVDTNGGARDLLEPGTAAYVEAAATDTRSGLDGETSYYRIELVLADQAATGAGDAGELLLAGDAFAGPAAPHLLTLERATIPAGGSVTLDQSAAGPTVILPTVGNIDVVADVDDSVNPVFEGTVIQLYGTGDITSEEGASVVVATLGAEVPAAGESPVADDSTPAASASASASSSTGTSVGSTPAAGTDGAGILAVDVLDCSGGSLLDTATCAPIPGVTLSLVTDGTGSTLTADDAGQVRQEIPVGASVTLSDPTGVPDGLVALNLPFAVDAFAGDYDLPVVFSLPNPTPDTTAPDTGTTQPEPGAGTPVAGDDGTGGPAPTQPASGSATVLVTLQALDCTRGDAEDLTSCVAMPNATFSVTAGDVTADGEAGYTTDANGYASFAAPVGAPVTATYAFGAPTGVAPNNDGQVVDAIAEDTTLTFVFVQVGGPLG